MNLPSQTPIWHAQGAEKRAAVNQMFAEIAPRYDLMNGVMSLSMHHRWRAYAASCLNLKPGDTALDLCCGTGDFFKPLFSTVGPQGHVFGLDFCLPMLQMAQVKHYPDLSLGDACALPLLDSSVNGCAVGWGLRNVPSLAGALSEIFRVLKPGARLVSLDMAVPNNPILRVGSRIMTTYIFPFFGKLAGSKTAYTYLPKSTEGFVSPEQLTEAYRAAGFVENGFKRLMLGNIAVVWGQKPAL